MILVGRARSYQAFVRKNGCEEAGKVSISGDVNTHGTPLSVRTGERVSVRRYWDLSKAKKGMGGEDIVATCGERTGPIQRLDEGGDASA